MAFFSATAPEYMGVNPIYKLKKISDVESVFKPGDLVGEISLQHFCPISIGKRKRPVESSEEITNESSKKPRGKLGIIQHVLATIQYYA